VIRRLTLQNWRAYENLELDFRPGATFVVAPNGVGKSSIVEGARFALFGFVPPAREGAARVARTGTTSASVEVELPSGRLLSVTRPYPAKPRGSTTPTVILDGEAQPPDTLEAMLAEEYGAEPAFLARLAMLHSSTVFAEAKGLDLRDHLCRVFGVDGLVAALDQTKTLAAVAKKTVESARKPVAAVADAELAALAEVEARAADLIEAADAERAEAEQALTAARAAAEARTRFETWKAAADRYTAVATRVAIEASALPGRPLAGDDAPTTATGDSGDVSVADLPGRLEAAEAEAVEALDDIRRRRAALTGRAEAIRTGLAELEGAGGSCPVCRRPLEPDDVVVARAGHERDLAALETELASLDEPAAVLLVTELRQLRHRLVNEPAPGNAPPPPDPEQAVTSEAQAMERFEAAVATAAERRVILAEARRRREAGESARVELEAVTAAFERAATLEAAAAALEAARLRILTESVEPLEELLADNWQNLFLDRPGVGLDGDGSVSRRIGDELLQYEQFSDGEKMVTQLLLRVLVLRATTRLGFFWVDEPLEHLDPDARRALAVLLAQAPEDPSFRQVLVTTYEEPLIRRLRGSIPNTHLVYVRPSAA
jgi:DNA repair exonuclease SbcCD ATPase subunit